jgi:hypothetical protein
VGDDRGDGGRWRVRAVHRSRGGVIRGQDSIVLKPSPDRTSGTFTVWRSLESRKSFSAFTPSSWHAPRYVLVGGLDRA